MTKRQSLKLLGEILLDRTNFKVMTRYIANEDNLKMMMNLLKDRSKNIQFEAFHVFKVGHSRRTFSRGREIRELTFLFISSYLPSNRSSSPTPRSRHRLKRSFGATRSSSSPSCRTSTTTARVSCLRYHGSSS